VSELSIVNSLFFVFAGAALLATAALISRQALLIAYIAAGVLMGPSVLNWVSNPEVLEEMSAIGILFLLFLLGMNLELAELNSVLKEAVGITALSSLIFAAFGFCIGWILGLNTMDCVLLALTMTFSSTIVTLKLLPTSALHHQHMGEIIVGILLLQDMLAILMIIALSAFGDTSNLVWESLILIAGLPVFSFICWWVASHWLTALFRKFDRIHEYVFLLAIAWCLGLAEIATFIGLSHEVGAFIAGVTLAASPIARFIAESLKPLRDFFLVLFFFALGAHLDIGVMMTVLVPAFALAIASVALKPGVFSFLLSQHGEKPAIAKETGARLGQMSEFSLLLLFVATDYALISEKASAIIQSATILSFVLSSYWIVKRYPTPSSVDSRLHRD